MKSDTIGPVQTEALIENLSDLYDVEKGHLKPEQVRRITVSDALVDTGATSLSMPTSLIRQLGLTQRTKKRARSSAGTVDVNIYDAVRLTIQGRDFTTDVMEVPDEVPVLIGQIPLEFMDFVVDPGSRRLIGNPAHGGEHILELY
ncbi:MAG: hypothetical protein EXS05_15935 [Planctomycetaceae bacterium]|nr:hypothetical protein [Planctomycetaceae bacterium]